MKIVKLKTSTGFVALASVLVVATVTLLIGISVSLLSIDNLQGSFSGVSGRKAYDLVEGCAENSLLEINNNNDLSSQISTPEGDCSITLLNQTGNEWLFKVSATLEGYTKSVQIWVTRDSSMTLISWRQVQ